MRDTIMAAVSCASLSLASLGAHAAEAASLQPAGYDPSTRMLCMYQVHEGLLIKRPICRTVEGWEAEKEHNRQVFREFQLLSLRTHR